MRFKDVSVGKRSGFGFGIITVLMILIGIFALTGLSMLNNEVETIVMDRLPKVVKSKDIIDNVNVNARALRNMILFADNTETVKDELKRIYAARVLMTGDVEKMGQLIKRRRGDRFFKEIKRYRPCLYNRTGQLHQADRGR